MSVIDGPCAHDWAYAPEEREWRCQRCDDRTLQPDPYVHD